MLFFLGQILEIRPPRIDRLRGVWVARQLRAPDEEDLCEVLPEIVPNLGPLRGLEADDHIRVHAQRLGQFLLRHEDPLPCSGQIRPVHLHRYTLFWSLVSPLVLPLILPPIARSLHASPSLVCPRPPGLWPPSIRRGWA